VALALTAARHGPRPRASALLGGAYILAAYPLLLAAGDVSAGFEEGVLYALIGGAFVLAGLAPLGRSRYLLPLGWVAMSLSVDVLVVLDVIQRSGEDWIPVSFALVLALPMGFALLALTAGLRGS
jgi:hypothetical protein